MLFVTLLLFTKTNKKMFYFFISLSKNQGFWVYVLYSKDGKGNRYNIKSFNGSIKFTRYSTRPSVLIKMLSRLS